MCVGLPGQIIEVVDVDNGLVRVRIGEQTHVVSAAILDDPDIGEGDWLEIHMGHALAKLSEDEAKEMLAFMEALDAAHRGAIEPVPPESEDEHDESG